jgi:surface antigen
VTQGVNVYGANAAPQLEARGAQAAYEAGLRPGSDKGAAAKTVAQALRMGEGGEDYVKAALEQGLSFAEISAAAKAGKAVGGATVQPDINAAPGTPARRAAEQILAGGGASGTALGVAAPSAANRGALGQAAGLAAQPLAATISENEKSLGALDAQINTTTKGHANYSQTLYGLEQQARKLGLTTDQLSTAQIDAMDKTGQAVARFVADTSATNLQAAGGAIAGAGMRGAGGNVPLALQQLTAASAAMRPDDIRQNAIANAMAQLQAGQQLTGRGLGQFTQQGQAITAGRAYAGMAPGEAGTPLETQRQAGLGAYRDALGARIDFMKQYLQADKELQIQWARQQEEAAIQVGRTLDDFHTQRLRQQRDFNIQLERMVQDNAKAIYDPYQRITAQSVWDTQSLLANIGEQNAAIARQTAQVRQLRQMGLSQAAVDQLSLMDPKNAMQVTRLVDEASTGNIRQLNAVTNQRLSATRAATVNENNETYRRQREDYQRSLSDSEKDLHKSLSRMNADLARSHSIALQDLSRMGDEVSGSLTSIASRFVSRVSALPLSAQSTMSNNLKQMVLNAVTTASEAITVALNPFGVQPTVQITAGTGSTYRSQVPMSSASPGGHPGIGSAPPTALPAISPSSLKASLPHSMAEAFAFGASQDAHATLNWHNRCDNFVAQAYGLAHSGYNTASQHWAGIPGGYKGGGTPPPGALVFWNTGPDGHVALSVGGGNVYTTDFVRDGHVDVARANDITKRWGHYAGWSYPYFHGQTTPIALGDGGIALRRGRYELAERGGGEAVIPLNDRGARVLAETMVRYTDQAATARTAPYASHSMDARSYAYDQRVMVTGPVTIPANDPVELARKMEDRARQARLVQPVGRGG